jgi:N-acetylmuramoyl-L-alanine amidase
VKSLVRAHVVVVAVTVAGTTAPWLAAQVGSIGRADPVAARATTTPVPPPPTRSARPRSAAPTPTPTPRPTKRPRPTPKATAQPQRPLQGITIALDPGHQLGNGRHPGETNALVPAGGFSKPCNTSGTATDSGVAEASVTFALAREVERRLEALGAEVALTRTTNSAGRWGPCVDARGRFGREVGARATISLHADGGPDEGSGFHVIAPEWREPWTSDIAVPSLRLAESLRDSLSAHGVPRADYVAGGTGLNVRDDLGTLNMSDVPVAMIEIGNMRNSGDAQRMTSTGGRARYAAAVVDGIRSFLGR